jgi:hypothetical protein
LLQPSIKVFRATKAGRMPAERAASGGGGPTARIGAVPRGGVMMPFSPWKIEP